MTEEINRKPSGRALLSWRAPVPPVRLFDSREQLGHSAKLLAVGRQIVRACLDDLECVILDESEIQCIRLLHLFSFLLRSCGQQVLECNESRTLLIALRTHDFSILSTRIQSAALLCLPLVSKDKLKGRKSVCVDIETRLRLFDSRQFVECGLSGRYHCCDTNWDIHAGTALPWETLAAEARSNNTSD